MKDGYKIVDVDSHMMEPDWLWERHIEDRYKSAAPKMGIASASGRRTFLVEGEPFTREKGKYPMAAPAFFKTVAKAMELRPGSTADNALLPAKNASADFLNAQKIIQAAQIEAGLPER